MSGWVVAHEEVLAEVYGGTERLGAIARALVVSRTTARRRCEELVARGWLGTGVADGERVYWLTEAGREAYYAGAAF